MRLKPNQFLGDESSSEEEPEYCVLGGEHLGAEIARRLQAEGHSVSLVDERHDPAAVPGVQGRPEDARVLEDAGVPEASMVIVATSQDSRNLLIAQIVKVRFGVSEVLVLVNTPDQYDLVAEAGHEPICATTVLSDTVVDELESTEPGLNYTA